MKTKTRKLIGKILVWGGLGVITFTTLNIIFSPGIFNPSSGLWNWDLNTPGNVVLKMMYANVVSIIALLVGGLWGMKQ